jgi:CheY-like chemotaxis protein/HPt (histidine-containing phosphotransfer) domain-containing protein
MDIDAKSILVVDDDQVSRELLLLLFKRHGHEVKTADSGAQALEYLRAQGTKFPQVIVADLQMPGISGEHLARALRELCGSSAVLIAISGSSPDEAASCEYDAFLLKPFTMEEFAAVIAGRDLTQKASRQAGVLDPSVFEKLASSMSREQLGKLYQLCLDDVLKRIAAMHEAALTGDDASYRRLAHAIKGGCGMVGAIELQSLASTMENNGLAAANYVATLHEFPPACERLRGMLNAREIPSM